MKKLSLLLMLGLGSCLLTGGCKSDGELVKCHKELEILKAELDSLKASAQREQNTVWTFPMNYSNKIKEDDTLRMVSVISNNYVGIDSTTTINLFHVTEIGDTIQLHENKYILEKTNTRGVLFYSITGTKKGKYFLESTINISGRDYPIYYNWTIQN